MNKTVVYAIALACGVAGFFLFQRYEIRQIDGGIQIVQRQNVAADAETKWQTTSRPPTRSSEAIRIASFNIQDFGPTKQSKPHVMDILSRIVRQFDVVAVQEISSRDEDLLPRFVDKINETGRHYDYVISERLGRTDQKEQYAFIFDRASVEVDRHELCVVNDPDDGLHREPYVGWFRVRGAAPEKAFTFTLVNIHVDPDEVAAELNLLDDVFHAVRNDGRNEDDVLLVGDFNTNDSQLGELGAINDIVTVIRATPTNTRSTEQYDNILFQRDATREFTGRGGVFDFLREYNLSMPQAIEVSDHMPIWAEFSIYEGGKNGQIAQREEATIR